MLRINGIVGYLSDADLSEKVHSLQHQGRLEILLIQPQDVARHRLRAVTDKGNECQIVIPRDQRLGDGAVLLLDVERAVVVAAQRAAVETFGLTGLAAEFTSVTALGILVDQIVAALGLRRTLAAISRTRLTGLARAAGAIAA